MAYKASFLDNEKYGADDFNAIVGDLIQDNGSGVVADDFDNTAVYQTKRMNASVKKLILENGTTFTEGSLLCSITAEGVKINTGLGIFCSGVKLIVTDPEKLSCEDYTTPYVYAYHDEDANTVGFAINEGEFPEETNTFHVIPLCAVVDGVLQDKRTYARANIRVCDTVNLTEKMVVNYPGLEYNGQEWELPIPYTTLINFMVFIADESPTKSDWHNMAIVEESDSNEFTIRNGKVSGNSKNVYLRYSNASDGQIISLSNFRRTDAGRIVATVNYHKESDSEGTFTMYVSSFNDETYYK